MERKTQISLTFEHTKGMVINMYILNTEATFDGAHFLHGYNGKCAYIHGHTFRAEAQIKGEKLSDGMVVDFAVFKKSLKKITDVFDHAFIFEKGTLKLKTVAALNEEGFKLIPVDFRPTAENFAAYIYAKLSGEGYDVNKVTVYETPENGASYFE